ncbi:hypothetical protein MQE22_13415 [Acidithiobacillus sp. YTS05]|uniref:hypothetical protein n=1 Tax=Acidithiobacillus caldus TaxID=33059 RepID=UPI001D020125|nr:hypothetical protein [Acidithiobacillus caldus]UTV80989.1 hypothetical protein MQE22_13415 [Acidithiobacillus sp. YTS05]
MRKTRFTTALLAALAVVSMPASALADPLSAMQADSRALGAMAQIWAQVQSAAQSYGQLAPYAAATWAGLGPVVTNPMGFREQCHNTRWDQVTQYLVTGALNIGGDGEAEAYAIQAVAADFPEQLSDYLVQLVQSGNPREEALANQIMAQKGPLLASLNDLSTLLNTTATQLSNAIGPNSSLQPLPITQWEAGIGDAPNLARAQYVAGPNDGAPIGWFDGIAPDSQITRLVDICPTGTGSLPTLPLKAPIMQAVQQAISDEPSLAQVAQPMENGSTWSAPSPYGFGGGTANPVREDLVAALATDETGIAGYMAPITAPLEQYDQEVQQIMQIIRSGGTEN